MNRAREGRPPTIDSVAARAGVGRGTVSRVVNGSAKIRPATRAAVLRAIGDLGYVPNRSTRTLASARRTWTPAWRG
jgi:DNA-binding LacI/PurR family transcriptional regulator